MASFKLNIADPKQGKSYKTEVKDTQAAPLMGLNIGEKVEGSKLGIDGYEFEVTGGMDYAGFPMRHGILGERKRITMYKGTGYKGGLKGIKRRKTVCGHKINDKISAVNLKVLKEGSKKLTDLFGKAEAKAEDTPKQEAKDSKPKPEEKKEAKPKGDEKPKADIKPEEKKEEKQQKSEEKKQEAPKK